MKVTGCTVHWADAGVDTGPIIAQEAVTVLPEDSEESLHERIKVVERRLLVQTLADLAAAPSPKCSPTQPLARTQLRTANVAVEPSKRVCCHAVSVRFLRPVDNGARHR